MYKKRFPLLLLLVTMGSLQFSFSQNLPSTLLWRINGNGLKQPSYLFGTMHLTDARIFNLGDSLYGAIAHSSGLEIEIDPQAFTPMAIDEMKKNFYDRKVYLKDIMPPDKFEKYGKMIGKNLKEDPNDLTTSDVLNQENKWITESFQTGKMETFLDTYLYDIARRLGKWTGGVEDAKDQENLIDEVDKLPR